MFTIFGGLRFAGWNIQGEVRSFKVRHLIGHGLGGPHCNVTRMMVTVGAIMFNELSYSSLIAHNYVFIYIYIWERDIYIYRYIFDIYISMERERESIIYIYIYILSLIIIQLWPVTHVLLTPWQVCWFAFLLYTIDSYCHHICDKETPNRHCRWFNQWILLPYTWGRPLFHPDPDWFPAPGISSFISVEGSIFLVSETISIDHRKTWNCDSSTVSGRSSFHPCSKYDYPIL